MACTSLPANTRESFWWSRESSLSPGASQPLGGDDHGLDGRRHLIGDLDHDHVGPGVTNGVLEVDLAAIDLDPTCVTDRLGDVLRGHRAEQAPIVARLLRDREDRAAEQR